MPLAPPVMRQTFRVSGAFELTSLEPSLIGGSCGADILLNLRVFDLKCVKAGMRCYLFEVWETS